MSETKSTKSTTKADKSYDGFTEAERSAMKSRAKELKSNSKAADAENEVLAKIAELPDADRAIAERLHALVKANAPELASKTWYGMPAYTKDGKTVFHFQSSDKFKTRYAMIMFSDEAKLDDGDLWPTAFALPKLTAATEKKIIALIKQAIS